MRSGARLQLLHIVALWGMAVAQPLFDLLGRNPTFFVYRRWGTLDFLLFVLLLSVLLPVALWALSEIPGRLVPGWRRSARAVPVLVLGAVLALPPLSRFELGSPWPAVVVAALFGTTLVWARSRFDFVRGLLSLLALATLVFAGTFLFREGVREQWLAPEAAGSLAGGGTAAPVIVLVFDALPTSSLMDESHEIDAIRYPNFARLASTATWFRRATPVDPFTQH
jgi:hypothetical protein